MKETSLHKSRRRAFILVMSNRGITIKQLAEAVAASPEDVGAEVNRITRIRRNGANSLMLSQNDATRYADALGVQVTRLLTGELTEAEKQASGGGKAAAPATKATTSKAAEWAAALKTRKTLGKDRCDALVAALDGCSHAALHSQLKAAGKQWTAAMVKSYVSGARYPNIEFLTDVAAILEVDAIILTIRDSPLENLGRRLTTDTPAEPEVAGILVSVSCNDLLGAKHDDRIVFDPASRKFQGQNVALVTTENGFDLVVTIPVTRDDVSKKLLGLVTQ